MTDLDTPLDTPVSSSTMLPRRPGLWRVVSLLAVVAAMIITAVSVLQARDASDVPMPDRPPIALEETEVRVSGIEVPDGAELAVLGLPSSDRRSARSGAGATIELPAAMAAMVALIDDGGDIVGMATVPPTGDRATIEITPRSTARALLVLAPGILLPDLPQTIANVAGYENDAAFDTLVEAIESNSNISQENPDVEQAFAAIADRLPLQGPAPRQGCDSVIARDAYPAAGACVQPQPTGIRITNEQDRWALLFTGDRYDRHCATIAPTGLDGAEILIPIEQCDDITLMVAPGPVTSQGDDQRLIDERIRVGAAVTALYDYAGPFADLAGGAAGFTDESLTHIRQNASDVVGSLAQLVANDDQFAAAMDVPRLASTNLDRHNAAIAAARLIIDAADTTALIPQRSPGETRHVDLLDFYVRAGERMVAPRTDWRWRADAVGLVDFGAPT